MVKRLLVSSIIVAIASWPIYLVHSYILNHLSIELEYNLLNTYLVYVIVYIHVTIVVEVVNKLAPVHLGLLYLWTFVAKLFIFGIAFYPKLFGETELSFESRLSLIVPLLIYIFFEVLYCVKIIQLTKQS